MSGEFQGDVTTAEEPSVFRAGSVSYLELPAIDIKALADFYESIFGWQIKSERRDSFSDGSGHVIGHFVPDLDVSGAAGPRPFIYVEGIDDVLDAVAASGGEIVSPKFVEGEGLWVATFRDPSGNVMGVWQLIPDRQ